MSTSQVVKDDYIPNSEFFGVLNSKETKVVNDISIQELLKLLNVQESEEVDDISITELLWRRNGRDEALTCRFSPLLVSLASSCELEAEECYQFVAKYGHLLKTYLLVYELVSVHCVEDADKLAFSLWRHNVERELEKHDSFVKRLGSVRIKETTIHPSTVKYTDFLLATASGSRQVFGIPIQQSRIPAYTLAAMMPSLRLHVLYGKAVRELVHYYNYHTYIKWRILKQSYESFKVSYLQAKQLLDTVCNSLVAAEFGVLERIYRGAMRLEMEFYHSRQSQQTLVIPIYTKLAPVERLILFADFDSTCSNVGSLETLVNIATSSVQKVGQQLRDVNTKRLRKKSADLRKTWELLSQQYTSEYGNCVNKIMLGKKSIRDGFDYEGLHDALAELSSCEERAVSRIFDSNLLNGISLEDIKQAGKSMILKNGCMDFFEKLNSLDASVNVMSCWSEDLTRSALSGGLDMLKVNGNEFRYANGIFTNVVTRQAHQSFGAKFAYLKDTVEENENFHGVRVLSVFIGDSVSDLLCLLEANIGIVIGHNKSLFEVGNHFGVKFVPLYDGVVDKQEDHSIDGLPAVWAGFISGVLYTVSSWSEVHAFILGLDL
ncbi:hypothetical protein MKW94_008899 [Papaver nudicaule]|uniref:Thiaminase-2/PQQC domain-containing protein n=1 Tax=Papaver nudicaule TaxID=74823 RepID=A0AA41UUW9_PAPNU|nr:hypothetical protein [Papaver nudicaule]